MPPDIGAPFPAGPTVESTDPFLALTPELLAAKEGFRLLMGVRLLGLTLCAPVFPGIAGLGYCEARIWAMLPPDVCWELATGPSKFDVA